MNLAWYGHLKFKDQPLWLVIVASWLIAFFEYAFQVPANRIGANEWTVPQLKILQELHHSHRVHGNCVRAISVAV
jgi:hypothetical protein